MNKGKGILLKRCYVDWKREKKENEAKRASLTVTECNEIQVVLEIKRFQIKNEQWRV